MAIELGLSDAEGCREVVVGQGRVDDLMAMAREVVGLTSLGPTASRGGIG